MNTAQPSTHFDDRLMRIIGVPILGFFIPLIFLGYSLNGGLVAYLPIWAVGALQTLVYWEGSRFVFIQTRRRFPLISQTTRRTVWLILLNTLFTITACTILNSGIHAWIPATDWYQPSPFQHYAASFIPTITCLALYESIYYFKQLQAALLEAEQLKKENMQSQLETLKNQVNPHFLFNSLNTLAAIIPDDAELSVRFVQKLSKVYRYILEIRDIQTVSLADELAALQAYTFLLQIRFGDNLRIHIDIPAERLTDRIVPLALQMLVENAVKHNVISTHKPLTIDVLTQRERVIVQNNLQRKNQFGLFDLDSDPDNESTGLGLTNIRNRYQLLANQPIDVIVTTQSFVVSLPLLKSERNLKSERVKER